MAGLVNFVSIGDKMLTVSSMETLIVECNHKTHPLEAMFIDGSNS